MRHSLNTSSSFVHFLVNKIYENFWIFFYFGKSKPEVRSSFLPFGGLISKNFFSISNYRQDSCRSRYGTLRHRQNWSTETSAPISPSVFSLVVNNKLIFKCNFLLTVYREHYNCVLIKWLIPWSVSSHIFFHFPSHLPYNSFLLMFPLRLRITLKN